MFVGITSVVSMVVAASLVSFSSRADMLAPSACALPSQISWSPDIPRAGTLFRITISIDSADQLKRISRAQIAGERLHLRPAADSARSSVGSSQQSSTYANSTLAPSATAVAAAPVDSSKGLSLIITCDNGSEVSVRVPTRSGDYKLERLSVAPRFTAPPDSALAARQRREAERAARVSRASHDTPRLWSETFTAPRASRITSGFGSGRTFNGAVTSRHMGTDYAGAVGSPVRATNRGVVRLVDAFYLGGNVIYLDHGEGLVSAYLHLSKQLVAEGDTVARGAVIGHVGATGRVTGPHLHFIARYGSITVDPLSLLAGP